MIPLSKKDVNEDARMEKLRRLGSWRSQNSKKRNGWCKIEARAIGELGTIPNQAAVMPAAKPGIHKVYVEANEDPVAMQKGHAKEMKLINVYETKVPVCQGRRKPLGRRTFSGWETPSP